MKKLLFLIICSFTLLRINAQVKIGSSGNPNTNAVLELDGGTNKGLLLPRISNPQMAALSSAPDGLMIYNTTDNSIYIRKIGAWRKITDALDGSGGLILPYTGAASATAGNNVFKIQNTGAGNGIMGEALGTGAGGFFNSVSGAALITGTGNVGIGTTQTYSPYFILTAPQFPLDISGRVRIRNYPGGSPGIWFDKVSGNPSGLEQSSFFGVLNDSIIGLFGGKHNQWKFFMNHDNNNFGIYNSNPRAPLSFQAVVGNKLDFYYVSPTSMYGLGLGSGELQLYTADNTHHTSIGYGSNAAFTETFRINNVGNTVTTNPVALAVGVEDASYFKTNNYYTGAIKTIGTSVAGARMAFFTYADPASVNLRERLSISDAGFVGIGNISPTRPLSFPATLEKKISLYPGGTGDVGFSVAGNELRLYGDNSNAAVTMGYDDFSNGFSETFRNDPAGNTTLTNPAAFSTGVTTSMFLRAGSTYTGAIKTIGNSFFGARMGFYTGTLSSLSENVTITAAGSVGINNSNPNSRLDVNGSVSMPIRNISSNYTITDNDYSIRWASTNASGTVTLPAAAGRTGRMYVISVDYGYSSGVFFPTLYVVDNNGTNVIANNPAYYDGTTVPNTTLQFNALLYVQFNNGETNLPLKRKVSITVQSDGSRWVIISGDFKN